MAAPDRIRNRHASFCCVSIDRIRSATPVPPAAGIYNAVRRSSRRGLRFDRDALFTIASLLHLHVRRRHAWAKRLDSALERQGSRRLDDVDAAAGARFGRARAEEGREREIHGADRVRSRPAQGLHRASAMSTAGPRSGFLAKCSASSERKARSRNYHLKLQFKWGDKKWPPRDRPATPRDSGLLYHVHAPPGAGRKDLGPLD